MSPETLLKVMDNCYDHGKFSFNAKAKEQVTSWRKMGTLKDVSKAKGFTSRALAYSPHFI